MDQQSWESARMLPDAFCHEHPPAFACGNVGLFEVDPSMHAHTMDFHDMEYLDLDSGHCIPGTAAAYRHDVIHDEDHLIVPMWHADVVPDSDTTADSGLALTIAPVPEGQTATSSSQGFVEDFLEPSHEEANDATRASQESGGSGADGKTRDPLDGLDDFRALLEAAENDEILKGGKKRSKSRKRPTAAATAAAGSPKRRKSKAKNKSLTTLVSECLPQLQQADAAGTGIVPKYRAKNRLRSIIKRKPGTQDTDLMSNNVEILGGRVDKQTLAWLRQNFEEQTGQIMRREFLYERYLEFCQATGREPMNAACVGKVVRTVFQGLSTRRLGRRGGSKYHYVNLQVAANSPFAGMKQSLGSAQKTGRKTKKTPKGNLGNIWNDAPKILDEPVAVDDGASTSGPARVWTKNQKKLEAVELDFVTSGLSDEERSRRNIQQLATNCLSAAQHRADDVLFIPTPLALDSNWNVEYLRDNSPTVTCDEIRIFLRCFRLHIGMLGGLIIRLHFHCIPNIIHNFWQFREKSLQVDDTLDAETFRSIIQLEPVMLFIRTFYLHLFEKIVTFFFPSKYEPVPDHLRAVFRDVTAKFDKWMAMATQSLPERLRDFLVSCAFGFGRVCETFLDLSCHAEHLSMIDKHKTTRQPFLNAIDVVTSNGCLMPASTCQDDRMSVAILLGKLRDLSDSRTMADAWEQCVHDHLQQRLAAVMLSLNPECMPQNQIIRQKVLDNFGAGWMRAVLEFEGASKFPVGGGCTSYQGVGRFLRDSVAYVIECEKAAIWDKSLLALNAEAIEHSVGILCSHSAPCDTSLEHYIQCGIPIPLVDSHSLHFFHSIPELRPWLPVAADSRPVSSEGELHVSLPGSPEVPFPESIPQPGSARTS
ncbi:uncharacterized protein LOC129582677 [Paramacrobiotus metropolitanus]|uniref:uncharacterized protein LOC129582677 n=1 Tax=Paramacrobiotus metropolitanus TaxID=2943436 RepID=UPI0024457D9C|nr:uncharacterized protein LOC129582677 [Paramacrobiotus metropolitanus]